MLRVVSLAALAATAHGHAGMFIRASLSRCLSVYLSRCLSVSLSFSLRLTSLATHTCASRCAARSLAAQRGRPLPAGMAERRDSYKGWDAVHVC